MDKLEAPDKPAPTLHPPASTPPNPIKTDPKRYRGMSLVLSNPRNLICPVTPAAKKLPNKTPATMPGPNPAVIALDAIAQKSSSDHGNVKAKDCAGSGSNGSFKSTEVPAHPIGTNSPNPIAATKTDLDGKFEISQNVAAPHSIKAQKIGPPGRSPSESDR